MPHPVDNDFIRQGKDYTSLICYKKAVIIYDITYYFAHKYLERGDRTVDQMIQAARSGQAEYSGGQHRRHHVDGDGDKAHQREPRQSARAIGGL